MIDKKTKKDSRVKDVFIDDEQDFIKSHAFNSELWELESFKK